MAHQRAHLSHGQAAIDDQITNIFWQRQKAHQVGNMASGFSNNFRYFSLCISEIFYQLPVAVSLFNYIQVGALNIFNQRHFIGFLIAKATDDRWHIMQLCHLGSAPAALASNQFIPIRLVVMGSHKNGLHKTLAADGVSQLFQRGNVEPAAGLPGPGIDPFDRNIDQSTLWCGGSGSGAGRGRG